jgi:hypothetical protein
MTAALSHATEAARLRTIDARQAFHRITLDYAARLIREALPDAAAITADTESGELHEVRDANGTALYCADNRFTSPGPLDHGVADDVDDLFRQAFPLGGLTEAGWEVAAEGEPYRSIALPADVHHRTAASRFPLSRSHGQIIAQYTLGGTPAFELNGLDDKCVRETLDRIRAAIANSGLEWKPGRLRLFAHWTVAAGCSADLALACTALAAAGMLSPAALNGVALIGELGLDGRIRPVHNVTAAVRMAEAAEYREFVVAADDFDEASRNEAVTVVGAHNLPAALELLEEMHAGRTAPTGADTTTTAAQPRPQGTPGEDAGPCTQCGRPLIWDGTGSRLNDEWGEYLCYGPGKTGGSAIHVLAQ